MISTGPPVIMKLRDSRHIRSIGISMAVPRPPWNCMQRSGRLEAELGAKDLDHESIVALQRPVVELASGAIGQQLAGLQPGVEIGHRDLHRLPLASGRPKVTRCCEYFAIISRQRAATPRPRAAWLTRLALIPRLRGLHAVAPSLPIRFSTGTSTLSRAIS